MHCSNCGRSISNNLNYCNNCGSRIAANALVVGNALSRPLSIGAAFVAVVGLICFVPLLRELLRSPLDQGAIIAILFIYLATVFGLFSVMIGHVWKHSGDIRIKAKGNNVQDEYFPPASTGRVNTAQLDEYREPAMSVTERTTRTLENVPRRDS